MAAAGNDLFGFSPMFITPQGATTKKLLDGTVDPSNVRPTADFSWPVWDVPLAKWVTSPNDMIDMSDHPNLRWFSLTDFFDQVHYLRQTFPGVELTCGKWDLAKYYRAFMMLGGAINSHMQLWSDEEGPFLIQDWRMMFGCRAAASFASRVSGFITWLMDRVIDRI